MLSGDIFFSKLGQEHHCSSPAEELPSKRDCSHGDNILSFKRGQHAFAVAPEWGPRRRFVAGCNFDAVRDMIDELIGILSKTMIMNYESYYSFAIE